MVLFFNALALASAAAAAAASPAHRRQAENTCTVTPLGNDADDTPQILQAFEQCGRGGTVVFPEGKTYNIATKLNPVLKDCTIEWRGTWLFSSDLDY